MWLCFTIACLRHVAKFIVREAIGAMGRFGKPVFAVLCLCSLDLQWFCCWEKKRQALYISPYSILLELANLSNLAEFLKVTCSCLCVAFLSYWKWAVYCTVAAFLNITRVSLKAMPWWRQESYMCPALSAWLHFLRGLCFEDAISMMLCHCWRKFVVVLMLGWCWLATYRGDWAQVPGVSGILIAVPAAKCPREHAPTPYSLAAYTSSVYCSQ